jgi:ABC-type polysaccharide/polyol phosphate transport system ATPase subunit
MTAEPTTDEEVAIRLNDVWVQYKLRHAHHYNLKRSLSNALTRRQEDPEAITALEGVTLDIPRGARLGLTGPNGSGKSTMLAVMAQALRPSRGTAVTYGRVLALLGGPDEGLDPEQTGRENAISLGIRLGETADAMQAKINDIQEFSGLGRRFDHPVYTYSSGMQVRLRFSAITSIRSDILLVDEGIGAADAEFNQRANGRLHSFYANSGTLVLASHSTDLLAAHCDRTLTLESGVAVANSPPPTSDSTYRAGT